MLYYLPVLPRADFPDYLCRIADGDTVGFYIPRHYRVGAYNHLVAYGYAGQHNRIDADQAILAD